MREMFVVLQNCFSVHVTGRVTSVTYHLTLVNGELLCDLAYVALNKVTL